MWNLTDRDRRAVRLGAIGVSLYLLLFYGGKVWGYLEERRQRYDELVLESETLKTAIIREGAKRQRLEKLRRQLAIDVERLDPETLVARATEALAKAAQKTGVGLGPGRETGAQSSDKELASLVVDGAGPVEAVVRFIDSLGTLGVPLSVERVHLKAVEGKPGQVQMALGIALVNPAAWSFERGSRGATGNMAAGRDAEPGGRDGGGTPAPGKTNTAAAQERGAASAAPGKGEA